MMTSYGRCLAVIRGEIPDRVPGYTPTVACDVASKILGREVHSGTPSLWYAEAKAWMAGKTALDEFEHNLEEDRLELHQKLGNDVFRFPWRKSIRPSAQVDESTFICGDPDGDHQVWRYDSDVRNFIEVKNTAPKLGPEDWPKLAKSRLKGVERQVAQARDSAGVEEKRMQDRLGDSVMVVAGGGGLSLGADEASLMACLMEPGAVSDMLDCQLQVAFAQVEGIASRGIKAVFAGGDMADKNGPLYSPQVFRELMLPRWVALAERCRELDLHYVWRTDGKIWSISDMIFSEARMPGFGEVDRDATMELGKIRDRYPDLVIWTNVSVDLLHRGSADDVYEDSLKILEESGGKGYFHGASNAVLPNTPPENVWAMMNALNTFNDSRLQEANGIQS
jgi:uroporphyrinogen decarboxylase